MTADRPGTDPASVLPGADLAAPSRFSIASGFEPDEVSGTRVTGSVDLGADHHTPWGVVHGGVYCAVVEAAASVGASAAVAAEGRFAVGVNNNTDVIRATT